MNERLRKDTRKFIRQPFDLRAIAREDRRTAERRLKAELQSALRAELMRPLF